MDTLCAASTGPAQKTWLQNECHTDWINIFTALCSMYVAILIIAYLRWAQDRGKLFSTRKKFHGHNVKNFAAVLLFLIHVLELTDAILADTLTSTFLVPTASFAFWGFAVILSHVLETSARPRLLPLTATLWALNGSARCLRIINLTGNAIKLEFIRPATAVLGIGLYGFIAVAELVAFALENPKTDVPLSTSSRYKHDDAHFLSKATFHWLTPLLRAGYSCPLEADDLGALPEHHKSKTQEERYEKISKNQKSSENSEFIAFWNVCWGFMKTDFILGGFLKLIGDLLSLVPPIGLAAFVTYFGSTDIKARHDHTTIDELWGNGWVVAGIVFLASIAQSTCSQSSTHLVNIRAINLNAAIQAKIYSKTLKLPKKTDEEFGDTLTHLLTEDAVNIMSAFWVGHYLWAIPLKIALLMILLYRYLGTAALVGSAVTIMTLTPLQLVIGRKMSRNTKLLSEITDERLFFVSSMIENMKLLKMLGWEELFCKKIEQVREREIRKLDRDSILWGAMTLLTHVASILVTVITLGTHSWVEDAPLTASTVFTALALFNQLTVPLFIFPVTIPIFISAFVSGKRIAEFLSQNEMDETLPRSDGNTKYQVTNLQTFPEEFSCSASLADMDSVWLPLTPLNSIDETNSLTEILEGIEEGNEDEPKTEETSRKDWALKIENCVFQWPNQNPDQKLAAAFITVPYGKLTIVVGTTGSGKSSLLSGILGEMKLTQGEISWQKGISIAYAGQTAWLINGTVRDNILFGRPFKPRRYGQVIHACALQPDLDILPLKDLTEVGERGIHLSGGQKQRIVVARALYSRANFVILDDPLSSLDNAVANQVFEAGIKRLTRRGKRTVLLATHQLSLLPHSDKVIVMENNRIRIQGELNEIETLDTNLVASWRETAGCDASAQGKTARERWQLVKHVASVGLELKQKFVDPEETFFRRKSTRRRKPVLSDWNFLSNDLPSAIEECTITQPVWRQSYEKRSFLTRTNSLQARNVRSAPIKRQHSTPLFFSSRRKSARQKLLRSFMRETPEVVQPHRKVERLSSTESGFSDAKSEIDPDEYELEVSGVGGSEDRQYGHVPNKILILYASSAGFGLVAVYFAVSLIWQIVRVATDGWLSRWTENQDGDLWYYLWIYNGLSMLTFLLSLASHAAGQWAGSKARVNLHSRLLTHMRQCTISAIQSTSSGRFLNRFSTDVNVIDKKLPTSVQRLVQFVLLCGSALFVNAAITPWFLLAGFPICLLYYSIQKFYRMSSRELHRLENISRSPIISHLLETQSGLPTIRAYCYQSRFLAAFFTKLDQHTNAFLILNSANRWLGIILDYLGSVIVAVAMITALITSHVAPGQITGSLAGLAINYTLLVPIYLNWVVKFLSECEMYMGAVERVNQILQLPVEEDNAAADARLPSLDAPQIRFVNVTLRYSLTTEPIFAGLHLSIPYGQKLGICGRSGSGKSTLALALSRLLPTSAGQILMDSTDLIEIPLKALRDRVAVVPQDAALLPGTVRENLDPKCVKRDADLWSALEAVRLAAIFKTGLDVDVAATGLSYGQRQLFCLARAILRNAPLLILDEASSNLDKDTEAVLMATAFRAFAGKIVLVIAHRLSTLLECDRILVIDRGRIVEDGAPNQLLNKQMGLFSTMLRSEDSF